MVFLYLQRVLESRPCREIREFTHVRRRRQDHGHQYNDINPIDRFHLTSRRPYWCTKTMKWRPYWCTVRVLALSYSNISYCFTTPLGPPITWVKTIYWNKCIVRIWMPQHSAEPTRASKLDVSKFYAKNTKSKKSCALQRYFNFLKVNI
jgi:hypothetical protein